MCSSDLMRMEESETYNVTVPGVDPGVTVEYLFEAEDGMGHKGEIEGSYFAIGESSIELRLTDDEILASMIAAPVLVGKHNCDLLGRGAQAESHFLFQCKTLGYSPTIKVSADIECRFWSLSRLQLDRDMATGL